MSRHYTVNEKQLALQRLVANDYHIRLTSLQTNIPQRTLLNWRLKHLPPITPTPIFSGESSLTHITPITPLPASESQALRGIQRQLMEKINRLSHSIDEAIDDAPLLQRAAALSQFIDRVIKISAQLPPDPEDYRLEDEEEEPDAETEFAHTAPQTVEDHQE